MPELVSGVQKTPVVITVYGPTIVGKSTFAAAAPDSVMLCVEAEGADRIDHPKKYIGIEKMLELKRLTKEMTKVKENTIIVDNVTFIEQMVIDEVLKKYAIKALSELPYGKATSEVSEIVNSYIKMLSKLRKAGKNVCVLAHSAMYKDVDPSTGQDIDLLSVSLRKVSVDLLTRKSDCVFMFDRVQTLTEIQGKNKKKDATLKSSGKRVLYMGNRPGL